MTTGVVELRQYTLLRGRRDELIEVFDRELVETQEACGMRVLGQFRDEDRPDRFVWLRWFADMEARREALTAFYGGPVWREHAVGDGDGFLATLRADNTFPALPVREDVDVVVRLGRTEPSSPALQVIRGTCTGRSLLP